MEKILINPIGVIRSPLRDRSQAPKQGREGQVEGRLVIGEKYREAMLGINAGMSITILYWLHLADRTRMKVHPRGNLSAALKGVFATRSPHRPNPIAVDEVKVMSVDGNTIYVRGLDALDGTPLLDIKCCLRDVSFKF